MRKILLIVAIALLASISSYSQKRMPPCPVETISRTPNLEDYNTYRDYIPIDNISESFDDVTGWWVQGRIFLVTQSAYVGLTDYSTVNYIEPFEGTTPIDGGHAFTAGWYILATVNSSDGLIVQSPFGNLIQHVPYDESDIAIVRIDNRNDWIYYSLDGILVFSQYAPGLASRDLRAYYIGGVDNALIGVTKKVCIHTDEYPLAHIPHAKGRAN